LTTAHKRVQLIQQARELQAGGRKVSVGIGMFDGVHLGHQQVIKQAVGEARQHRGLSLAITFDRHPSTIVNPAKTPPLIYPLAQKLREIAALGVDAIQVIEFTREFSQQTGEQFARGLAADLGAIHGICVGSTFAFGHKRSGNVELLKSLGAELGFQVHGLAAVSLAGQVVSSTRIRERIAKGDLYSASQMLGRSYSIAGEVARGEQLGRKLGFPTANLPVTGLALPPHGVYAVMVRTPAGLRPGAANLGARPTVGGTAALLEVHLLDFEGELYGQEIEVIFTEFIRTERKFSGTDELASQIRQDVAAARKILL